MITARRQKEIDDVSKEIHSGGKAISVVADVSREKDCEEIVNSARKAFGAIHILVNNAGVLGPVKSVEKITPSEWDEVMAVNLRGPFQLSRLVLTEMYERGSGAILTIVGIAAKAAFQLNAPYAASKAGLTVLPIRWRPRQRAKACA